MCLIARIKCNRFLFIILLIANILFLNSGCATYRPNSNKVSGPDNNGKYKISEPHYKKTPNALGITAVSASTIAGGYLGYQSHTITYYQNGEKQHLQYADAAIGALVGFTTSYILNRLIGGVGKTKKMKDPNKWMQKSKINDEYNIVNPTYDAFTIIDKSYESKFKPKNYKDIKEFDYAFGAQSQYLDNTLIQALPYLSRNEVMLVINKYPKTKSIDKIKYDYIDKSENVTDLFLAKHKFSDINYDYISKTQTLIRNTNDFLVFNQDYPDKSFDNGLFLKIIQSETDKSLLEKFIDLDIIKQNDDILFQSKKRYITLSSNVQELQNAINKYEDVFSMRYPDFMDVDTSIAFYTKVISNLDIDEKIKKEYKNVIFQKFVTKPNKDAILFTGGMYYFDYKDYEEALRWFRESANNGYNQAQLKIGIMYYEGLGTNQNYKLAFEWIKKSAEKGNTKAQAMLGEMYFKGKGIAKNEGRGSYWLQKSKKEIEIITSTLYLQNIPNNIKTLIQESESGNMKSRFELSKLYTLGEKGVPLDKDKGISLLISSAYGGYVEAQTTLADLFIVSKKYNEALDLLELAAIQGHTLSQVLVAKACLTGEWGVKRNNLKAFKYYKMAAEQGNADAQTELGVMYAIGQDLGVEQNINKSVKWLEKAAKQGHVKAEEFLTEIKQSSSNNSNSSRTHQIEISWYGEWKPCNRLSSDNKCQKKDFSIYDKQTLRWFNTNGISILKHSDSHYYITVWIGTQRTDYDYYPNYNGFATTYKRKNMNIKSEVSSLDEAIYYSIQCAFEYFIR